MENENEGIDMERLVMKENEVLKKEIARLQKLSEYDSLCGVYNKWKVEELINQALAKTGYGVLMVIDLNRFKFINDNFGHLVGDKTLKLVAEVLNKNKGENGIVGRVGGDEFVVFYQDEMCQKAADSRMAKIKYDVNAIEVLKQGSPKITLSIFMAFAQANDSYNVLFDRADQLLASYKRTRRSLNVDVDKVLMNPDNKYFDYELFYQLMKKQNENNYHLLMVKISKIDDDILVANDDEGIQILYACIHQKLREGDFFTRYSSNQFLILCQFIEKDKLPLVKQRIRETFMEMVDGCYRLRISTVTKEELIDVLK